MIVRFPILGTQVATLATIMARPAVRLDLLGLGLRSDHLALLDRLAA